MSHKSPKTGVGKGRPIGAQIWRNDVTVNYSSLPDEIADRGERSDITMLSRVSLRRLAFVAHNTSITFDCMATLTYPRNFSSDGQEVKRHLQRWLQWAKRTCRVDAYLWALEFQRRGAPHFHVFTAGGLLLNSKLACSEQWYYIVNSQDDNHLKAGTRVERLRKPDAAGRYAAKYASKPHQKAVPPDYRNVGRFWGHSYNVKPEPLASRTLEGWGDLIQELDGWEYQQRLMDRKPTSVLYNAGKFLQELYSERETLQLEP